ESAIVRGEGKLTDAFLQQAALDPARIIAEDELLGPTSYRKMITLIHLFKEKIERMPGDKVGIMLPPSVGNVAVYLATLFSGKTPVMVNFTAGAPVIEASLAKVGVDNIVTAGKFVDKLVGE